MHFAIADTSNTMRNYLQLFSNSSSGGGYFIPLARDVVSLGLSGNAWSYVYSQNGCITTSDSSLKSYVALPYGLKEILQMNTIMFKWKSQDDLPDSDPTKSFQYYGFCANELQPLLPELVYNEDPTAPIQMNYSEILPIVVKAIQEQNQIIQEQNQIIQTQATQINALQEQNVILTSQLNQVLQRLTAAGIA